MPFAAALSTVSDSAQAVAEVCNQALAQLGGTPDLAVLFISAHHVANAEAISALVRERLSPRCLLGCPGESIVGNDQEIEQGPAVSLWLARWSQRVELAPFQLMLEETADGY